MTTTTYRILPDDELLKELRLLVGRPPEPKLDRATTAFLIIDMQYGTCHRDYGVGARWKQTESFPELEYYFDRLENTVIPNVQRLMATCRAKGVEVIHLRVAAQTRDARDSTLLFRSMGKGDGNRPKHDIAAQILPDVGPQGDEIVLTKTTSNAFYSTNIDQILRSLGVRNVIVVGVVTQGCVAATVHGASEHDYGVILVEDGTAAYAPQFHGPQILTMAYQYATIKSTDEVIEQLEAL